VEEGFRDPGTLILMRLQPASLKQRKGILVPARLREIMAKNGGGGLGFAGNAKREISLSQPLQGFLCMAGRLIFEQYLTEAIDCRRIIMIVE